MTKENRKKLYLHFKSIGKLKEAADVVAGTNEAAEFDKVEAPKEETKSRGKK